MGARLKKDTSDVKRADRRLIGRSSPADNLHVVDAEGAWVIDAQGRRYIDFLSGWCVGNLGWGCREILDAVRRFDGPEYVPPGALYQPWTDLAARLCAVAPGRLQRCFRATTGTEAVELAMQIAMAATGRHKFVSIEGAYHGNSFGARSIGAESRERYPNLLPGCKKLAPPLDERALGRLETLLSTREFAALILEPVITALGVCIPEPVFMEGAQSLCRRFGTLLVVDEVATGFGRTGALFASEHYRIEPDVMCLAKAMAAGAAPIAATLVTPAVAAELDEEFDFYATMGWHPIAVAAALANLRYWERHGERLLRNVAERSAEAVARLGEMGFAEVRVKGLAIACDVAEGEDAEALGERCREAGLLVAPEDDHLMLLPPLTIDRDTLAAGLDVLEECVAV